jgi:predicted nucleic acid-binding protein
MNVVDSSGWLEYFSNGPNADFFSPAVITIEDLVVPSLSIFEVFKRVLQQRSEDQALQIAAAMRQGRVVDLTADLAISAARLSTETKLPLADSIILATSRAFGATLWTQDSDFEGMGGVRYVKRYA